MASIDIAVGRAARRVRSLDRVLLTILLIALALVVFMPDQAWRSTVFVGDSLLFIVPFLVLSVAVAGAAKATGADTIIGRVAAAKPGTVILAAAVFGGLSPFCSCGVIPIIAALLAMGVPLPAVMAFWLSSPVMDPAMFVLTAGALGTEFAVIKTLIAVGLGLGGGYATKAVLGMGGFTDPLRPGVADRGNCAANSMVKGRTIVWRFWGEPERRAAFTQEAGKSGWFLLKWLTLAFILESLMVQYLPGETVSSWLGLDNSWAIPTAVVVGVPAYLNGYAALPLVAGLMDMGMAPGAAMGFLIAGSVTSIPAAMAVFALVRWPVFLWYLVLALAGSAIAAYAYQAWVLI
jgi:uncharacterized membrane protein YraQ (UPF0718 family)